MRDLRLASTDAVCEKGYIFAIEDVWGGSWELRAESWELGAGS